MDRRSLAVALRTFNALPLLTTEAASWMLVYSREEGQLVFQGLFHKTILVAVVAGTCGLINGYPSERPIAPAKLTPALDSLDDAKNCADWLVEQVSPYLSGKPLKWGQGSRRCPSDGRRIVLCRTAGRITPGRGSDSRGWR